MKSGISESFHLKYQLVILLDFETSINLRILLNKTFPTPLECRFLQCALLCRHLLVLTIPHKYFHQVTKGCTTNMLHVYLLQLTVSTWRTRTWESLPVTLATHRGRGQMPE